MLKNNLTSEDCF